MDKDNCCLNTENEKSILNSLSHHNGSETFLRDRFPLRNGLLTEGFQDFLKLCECEWLYSDIAVICNSKFLNKEDFIICKIIKEKDKKGCDVFLYSDYNSDESKTAIEFNKEHLLYKQHYDYTDFPLSSYDFYIIYNELNTFTYMLKSEY